MVRGEGGLSAMERPPQWVSACGGTTVSSQDLNRWGASHQQVCVQGTHLVLLLRLEPGVPMFDAPFPQVT